MLFTSFWVLEVGDIISDTGMIPKPVQWRAIPASAHHADPWERDTSILGGPVCGSSQAN